MGYVRHDFGDAVLKVLLNVFGSYDGCFLWIHLLNDLFGEVPGLAHRHMPKNQMVEAAEHVSVLVALLKPCDQIRAVAKLVEVAADDGMTVEK